MFGNGGHATFNSNRKNLIDLPLTNTDLFKNLHDHLLVLLTENFDETGNTRLLLFYGVVEFTKESVELSDFCGKPEFLA